MKDFRTKSFDGPNLQYLTIVLINLRIAKNSLDSPSEFFVGNVSNYNQPSKNCWIDNLKGINPQVVWIIFELFRMKTWMKKECEIGKNSITRVLLLLLTFHIWK